MRISPKLADLVKFGAHGTNGVLTLTISQGCGWLFPTHQRRQHGQALFGVAVVVVIIRIQVFHSTEY